MPGTPGARTGLASVITTDASTAERTTINAIIAWLEANAMLTSSGLLADRPVSTPSTPGISGRRYYAIDTGVEYRDTGTGWVALGVELVTALPTAPFNGQRVDYLADAAAGVVWPLRYRAASTSAYKWEAVGAAPPLEAHIDAQETAPAGAVGVDLATVGPTVTVPLAGDYDITINFEGWSNAGAGSGQVTAAVSIGGAATVSDLAAVISSPAAGFSGTAERTRRKLALAAASTLRMKYSALGAVGDFRYRTILARPVRVG